MKLVRTVDGQVNPGELHRHANAGVPHHPYSFTVVGLALSTNPIVDNNGHIVDLPPECRVSLEDSPNYYAIKAGTTTSSAFKSYE